MKAETERILQLAAFKSGNICTLRKSPGPLSHNAKFMVLRSKSKSKGWSVFGNKPDPAHMPHQCRGRRFKLTHLWKEAGVPGFLFRAGVTRDRIQSAQRQKSHLGHLRSAQE